MIFREAFSQTFKTRSGTPGSINQLIRFRRLNRDGVHFRGIIPFHAGNVKLLTVIITYHLSIGHYTESGCIFPIPHNNHVILFGGAYRRAEFCVLLVFGPIAVELGPMQILPPQIDRLSMLMQEGNAEFRFGVPFGGNAGLGCRAISSVILKL